MSRSERPPARLSASSKKLYRQILEAYSIDAPANMILMVTLQARDRMLEARAAIEKDGCVLTDRYGVQKPSPWCAIERDSTSAMMRGFRLLGMDLEKGD